jgi:hypothetical protein
LLDRGSRAWLPLRLKRGHSGALVTWKGIGCLSDIGRIVEFRLGSSSLTLGALSQPRLQHLQHPQTPPHVLHVSISSAAVSQASSNAPAGLGLLSHQPAIRIFCSCVSVYFTFVLFASGGSVLLSLWRLTDFCEGCNPPNPLLHLHPHPLTRPPLVLPPPQGSARNYPWEMGKRLPAKMADSLAHWLALPGGC